MSSSILHISFEEFAIESHVLNEASWHESFEEFAIESHVLIEASLHISFLNSIVSS